MSTPPNSLVPGLDVGELTQSSCCEDEDEELSVEDDGAYMCRCRKVTCIGQGLIILFFILLSLLFISAPLDNGDGLRLSISYKACYIGLWKIT